MSPAGWRIVPARRSVTAHAHFLISFSGIKEYASFTKPTRTPTTPGQQTNKQNGLQTQPWPRWRYRWHCIGQRHFHGGAFLCFHDMWSNTSDHREKVSMALRRRRGDVQVYEPGGDDSALLRRRCAALNDFHARDAWSPREHWKFARWVNFTFNLITAAKPTLYFCFI